VLPQAVTTGWCTELGATLVFGFDSTIEGSAYFRYLCAYQSATESLHEPSSSPGWARATRALSLGGAPHEKAVAANTRWISMLRLRTRRFSGSMTLSSTPLLARYLVLEVANRRTMAHLE
jgi:hypothetical protein